jgi:hypothetical protein
MSAINPVSLAGGYEVLTAAEESERQLPYRFVSLSGMGEEP